MRSKRAQARASLLVLVALVVFAAACTAEPVAEPQAAPGDQTAQRDQAPGTPTPPAREPEEPEEPEPTASPSPAVDPPVPEALDFTAPGIDGGQVVGAEYAGQAVALWFWAPW
jgi:hypothetical protein